MKKNDLIIGLGVILFFLPFFAIPAVFDFYQNFNHGHGMIMAFLKFAVLATFGELIGLRIKTGKYYAPNFGIMPRVVIWGILGLTIKGAFIIFASGTPNFLVYIGLNGAVNAMNGDLTLLKLISAFSISLAINTIYAPIMMTMHKITDTHIVNHGGSMTALIKPIKFGKILRELNWDVQWNFVFKKTIPFFWIPAHTITFLLPIDWQIFFAAFLGIALGIILATASLKSVN